MRTILFSRFFPAKHPRAGESTFFVEKIWKLIYESSSDVNYPFALAGVWSGYCEIEDELQPKLHTIRAGNRFKEGDKASLRVWSDKPYRSKQIEFAQVDIVKTYDIEIWVNTTGDMSIGLVVEPGRHIICLPLCDVAKNDGLECGDFMRWFTCHPKKKSHTFTGQIICWKDPKY